MAVPNLTDPDEIEDQDLNQPLNLKKKLRDVKKSRFSGKIDSKALRRLSSHLSAIASLDLA
jgi:hypothetical protein